MNEWNDVTQVIQRTYIVENLIDQSISTFLDTQDADVHFFVKDIILNSSVISLGGKIRVVAALAQKIEFKLDRDPLHRLLALRNAFAHQGINANPRVVFEGDDYTKGDTLFDLVTLSNSGNVKRISREEALTQFNEVYSESKNQLHNLLHELNMRNRAKINP